jgi:hypothetical protein
MRAEDVDDLLENKEKMDGKGPHGQGKGKGDGECLKDKQATSSDEPMAQRTVEEETAKKSSVSAKIAGREALFFYPNGGVFARVHDLESALKLFSEGNWDFQVGGRKYRKDDWRGREALESLFETSDMYKHVWANLDGLRSRRAMYWCAPDRTFSLTQQEQANGTAMCPQCKCDMNKEKFTRSDKLLMCPECGFKVPSSKTVTQIEVKVPENVSVEVTHTDGAGVEVCGENITAGLDCRRGRLAYADPTDVADLPRMSLSQISDLVYKDWKSVNYAAKPYLEAMSTLQNVSDMYMQDSGTSIVAYFLSNATSWRGDVAKAVKKELQRRIRR